MRERSKRDDATVHEQEVMGLFSDGRVHGGSGSSPNLKSDGHTKDLQIEAKMTRQMSLTVKQDWLRKIQFEARRVGRVPALALRFAENLGHEKDWIMVPAKWLAEVLEELNARGDGNG